MHLQVKADADAMRPREVRVDRMLHRRGPHQQRAGGRRHDVCGPRVGFDALALDGDPTYPPDITLAPVAGILMLWPGYLRCCSRVHLAREPWVRVALRIELDGKPKAETQ